MWLEEVISRVERAIAENQHQKWLYDEQAVALCDPNRIRRSKEWLRKAALAAIEEVYAKAPSPHKEVEDDPDAP